MKHSELTTVEGVAKIIVDLAVEVLGEGPQSKV